MLAFPSRSLRTLAASAAVSLAACSSTTPEPPAVPVLAPAASATSIEGSGAAATTLELAVGRVGSSSSPVSVDWTLAAGTATAGADFQSASGTLTIPAGSPSGTVQVVVVGDDLDEDDESFTIVLSNPVGATLAATSAVAWITDDDPTPTVSVQPAAPAPEGTGANGTMVFPVALSAPSGRQVTVAWATAAGTAAAPGDFTAATGTLVFSPGETARDAVVAVVADAVDEEDESLGVTLSGPVNAVLGAASATGTVVDDDLPPLLSIASASVPEGPAGGGPAVSLDVTLDAPSGRQVTVAWATGGGTATAGADYDAGGGTLTFAAGETLKTVSVQIVGDDAVEPDETVEVALADAVNATLPAGAGTITVANDDVSVTDPRTLNDTGVTACGDADFANLACPVAGIAGQDAEHGRDATAADPADGDAGFSLVKLDATGAPLADQAVAYATTPWPCVRDAVTGLTWEVKTLDGGLHDANWFFTWYGTDPGTNGGTPGTPAPVSPSPAMCFGNARCDTQKFVADVNASGWCGFVDWRLPTIEELHSISHLGRATRPFLDAGYFATVSSVSYDARYWSGNTWGVSGSTAYAWGYDFGFSNNDTYAKSSRSLHVMLVRGP
jgi:hypothetical protein